MPDSKMTKWQFAATAIIFLALLSFVFSFAAETAAQKKPAEGAPGIFAPDKGKLKIILDGQSIGSEAFEIAPSGANWTACGSTELKVPDGSGVRVNSTLVLSPAGAPLSYEWTAQTDKKNGAHIVFENGVAKISLEMEGARPFQQELTFNSSLIAVLDNNLYHHYAVLARIYDWSKGGAQSFPVLIPQDLTPGSITVESTGAQTVDGKSYGSLRVSTADLEVLVYVDANHRLMRLEVPSAKASVVRE